jgi:type I restriction enzyme M protein
MVDIVDPKKHETVLDPACGTAGFLISSYKHILEANRDAEGNNTLSPDEEERLARNFTGYDISPDMVRLSRANMYLHGFVEPHIFEYDTLTSEAKWGDFADVILANPPFMSPKGGIQPHKRFGVQSKRSEVLFVDYIMEHLTPTGRAAVIVPEGIIFQSQRAYKQLRKKLVEEYLIGVISLPSGVFMPYTGVKTSILVLDRTVARKNPDILFSEVKHIGMSLGVKRTPTEKNDLPDVLDDYRAFYSGEDLSRKSWTAPRSAILANGVDLTGNRYRPVNAAGITRWATIEETCSITKGASSSTKTTEGPYPLIVRGENWLTSDEYQFDGPTVCVPLLSLDHGRGNIKRLHFADGRFALANLMAAVQPIDPEELDAKYLYFALDAKKYAIAERMQGAVYVTLKLPDLGAFQFPLPPLEVQREIVAEIDGYQKVIDGARAVVENYRPHIPIDPEWPMVRIDAISKVQGGIQKSPDRLPRDNHRPFLTVRNVQHGYLDLTNVERFEVTEAEIERLKLEEGDILVVEGNGSRDQIGRTAVFDIRGQEWVHQNHVIRVRLHPQKAVPGFIATFLQSDLGREKMLRIAVTTSGLFMLSVGRVSSLEVPLPSLATQQAIVAEIEAEQALVDANRELITRMEAKIQATLARVWGEEPATP